MEYLLISLILILCLILIWYMTNSSENLTNKELSERLKNPKYVKGKVNCPGFDIKDLDTSASGCMDLCANTKDCVGTIYSDAGHCWLKSKLEGCINNNDTTVLVNNLAEWDRADAASRTAAQEKVRIQNEEAMRLFNLEKATLEQKHREIESQIKDPEFTKNNIDCQNFNIGGDTIEPTPFTCLDKCKSTAGCNGASYNNNTKRCYLKSKTTDNCVERDGYVMMYNNRDDWKVTEDRLRRDWEGRNDRVKNLDFTRGPLSCPGNDIGIGDFPNINECVKFCDKDLECRGVEYKADIKRCWKKNRLSNCFAAQDNAYVSAKLPEYIKPELDRLASILTPEEQEKKLLIDKCKSFNIPNYDPRRPEDPADYRRTTRDTWTQEQRDTFDRCKGAGILQQV